MAAIRLPKSKVRQKLFIQKYQELSMRKFNEIYFS